MKLVIAIVLLFVVGFLLIGMGSDFAMKTIDSGMHNGSGGSSSFSAGSSGSSWFGGGSDSAPEPGDVSANPYAE